MLSKIHHQDVPPTYKGANPRTGKRRATFRTCWTRVPSIGPTTGIQQALKVLHMESYITFQKLFNLQAPKIKLNFNPNDPKLKAV